MFKIRLTLFMFLGSLATNSIDASNSSKAFIYEYIDQYKSIAISEMERSGIPASIKLAQGLLESDFGRSNLANEANNHFGIKCGSSWNGGTFYKEDDDYKKGKLIKSCFRAFESAEQSYIEHTEFLKDPKKSYRYGSLFDNKSTDYVAWALGLKKAGYATDPKYPDKLIMIIENYNLYKYDVEINISPEENSILVQAEKPIPSAVKIPQKYSVRAEYRYKKSRINQLIYVKAKEGDTPMKLAKMYKMSVRDLLEYNEDLITKDQQLTQGERVFLEKKKKSYKDKKYHKVRRGESMYDIAQMYGLSLNTLYSRNRIPEGFEPKAGEKIQLKGTRFVKSAKVVNTQNEPEFLFEDESK